MRPKLTALWLAPRQRAALLACAAAIVLVIGWRSGAFATPPAAPDAGTAAAPATLSTDGEAPTGVPADPTKVQIVIATVPPANATVSWGRMKLGKIKPRQPLVIVRPRDSGPLDVVVRAPGYLPVQTRAHTFSDLRVHVKLTPLSQKSTLLGYRAPLDAGMGMGDGGVPETLTGMPPSLTNPSLAPPLAPAQPGQLPAQPQPAAPPPAQPAPVQPVQPIQPAQPVPATPAPAAPH